ncbi:NAD(P)-dependent oxidoreductase [Alphaproteobacteria bacterium]|nr:NAD(P)-dependent oxidoreductase [Alphaproteobacteria bacterium]
MNVQKTIIIDINYLSKHKKKMNIKDKNILITGASGLLGLQVCKKLSPNNNLFVLQNLNSQNSKDCIYGKSIINVNLENLINTHLLPSGIDNIIYMAQANSNEEDLSYKNKIYNINSINAYELGKWGVNNGVKSFIYCSSGGVYPLSEKTHDEEELIPHTGNNEYIASKIIGEILLNSFKSSMNVVTLRPFFILGRGHNTNNLRLFSRILNKIKNREIIDIEGVNGTTINPIDVENASNALIKSMSLKTNEIFNISGSENFTIREIISITAEKLGIEPNIRSNNSKSKIPQKLVGDNTKMKKKLGIYPKEFKKALIKFVENN